MRKRIGTFALMACALSFAAASGVQAQQHGHGRGNGHKAEKVEQHRVKKQAQLTKKEQKALAKAANSRVVVVHQPARVYGSRAAPVRVVTVPTYRYRVSGLARTTSRSGAELLQRAVQLGYQQGYQSGHMEGQQNARFDFRDDNGYRLGTVGFTSGYVAPADYSYYYRQGFERGYQDGYGQRTQYGSLVSGKAAIAAAVVAAILGFTVH